jgi:hypothetical protein
MNEKKPIIIACAVLGLIVLAGGSAIYYFNFVILPEKQKILNAAIAEVKKAKDKRDLIPKIQEQIKDLRAQEVKKKTRIPDLDGKEYDGLANLLDEIRKRAGVEVAKGSYSLPKTTTGRGAPTANNNVHKVQYDLGAKGGFHQLLRYLNMLEKDRRFMNVESFTISKGADTTTRGGAKGATQAVRELKVTLTTYTYRPLGAPAAATIKKDEDDKGGQSTDVPQ